jgi:hypothetical protein
MMTTPIWFGRFAGSRLGSAREARRAIKLVGATYVERQPPGAQREEVVDLRAKRHVLSPMR